MKMFVKSNLNLQKGLKKCNRKFNKESGNIRRGNIRKLKMRMLCLTLLCLCLTGFTPDKFTKEEAQKQEKEAMEIFNRYLDEELGGGKIESVSVHKGTRRGKLLITWRIMWMGNLHIGRMFILFRSILGRGFGRLEGL